MVRSGISTRLKMYLNYVVCVSVLDQSFELGFNKACALLDLGEFAAAETELRMALKTGREALFEEDCTEEEVAEELAPLTVQLGYALGQQGKTVEALEIYEQVG